ncbi:MAG TPA: TrmH family RNA methyltransferase [Acidimicrobiales bacterium]|nr:TrmH family RNA methyltransferase [Acidimicrobiales bacterium]
MSRALDPTGLKRLHRGWRRRTTARLGLVLDGVQSPFNVGSIVRTAAALGVEHLWLAGQCATPADPKTGKTALGTQRLLEWSHHGTAAAAVAEARAAGFRVVGLELTADAAPLPRARLEGDVCLMVGHEDHGLSPASLALCDEVAYVPQLGRVGSLNVATATAVGLYEVRRREWAGAGAPPDDGHDTPSAPGPPG